MTITEAHAVNTLLRALTNEECGWEQMARAGAVLADHAHKVLMAGHDARSFKRALAKGQGIVGAFSEMSMRPKSRPLPEAS